MASLTPEQQQALKAARGRRRGRQQQAAYEHYRRRRTNIRNRRARAGLPTDQKSMEEAIGKLSLPVDPLLPPDQNNFYVYNQEYIFPDGKIMIKQFKSFRPIDERELAAMTEDYWEFLKMYQNQDFKKAFPGGRQVYSREADMEAQRNQWPVPYGPATRVAA